MTRQHQAALRLAGVDSAEAWGGEGHEQPRMGGHGLGDALAALEPSGQELVGIRPVGGRTGRAAGLPSGAASLEQHPIRLPPRVVHLPDLAALAVGLLDPAGQADGVVAVAGLGDQLGPPLIAVAGPVHELPEDAGEQLAHPAPARSCSILRCRHRWPHPQPRRLLGQQRGRVGPQAEPWPGRWRRPGGGRPGASGPGGSPAGPAGWSPPPRHRRGRSAGRGRRRGAGGSPRPSAATAPSMVRVAKEMATWQLSRIRVGMASPVARWVSNMTWMATLRPFRISSSTSRDSSATRALWALTSGEVPLRSWKKVCASSITTTTSGQVGDGPRCQASVMPSTLAMAPWRSTMRRCTCRRTSRTSVEVVFGRQPGSGEQPVIVRAALAVDQHELDGRAGSELAEEVGDEHGLAEPGQAADDHAGDLSGADEDRAAVLGPPKPPRGQGAGSTPDRST